MLKNLGPKFDGAKLLTVRNLPYDFGGLADLFITLAVGVIANEDQILSTSAFGVILLDPKGREAELGVIVGFFHCDSLGRKYGTGPSSTLGAELRPAGSGLRPELGYAQQGGLLFPAAAPVGVICAGVELHGIPYAIVYVGLLSRRRLREVSGLEHLWSEIDAGVGL